MRTKFTLSVVGLCLVLALLMCGADAFAAFGSSGGPMSSVVTKTNEARDIVVTIGKAAVGLVAAVLFFLAIGGKVAWHWVIMVVVAGAGLTGLDAIVGWING